MNRRRFTKLAASGSLLAMAAPGMATGTWKSATPVIILGGPVFGKYGDPGEWVRLVREAGYRAAYSPIDITTGSDERQSYRKAAKDAGLIISEVGVWNNPLSTDEDQRKSAVEKCITSLQLADDIGANCCVNISGSRNEKYWAGPHEDNLTNDTFNLIVETTRKIIDAVKPVSTWFTLEAMPWAFPYSPESYLRLIKAIDRERFAVHLDTVNMVVSPETYFYNGKLIRECFTKLGPHIRSCHAKDIILREDIYTPHLDELRPGLGKLDYRVFLTELSKLDGVPLMMEHLNNAEEYSLAAGYIRSVAKMLNLAM
jgi:sugar phosphate isomerase/epimerase